MAPTNFFSKQIKFQDRENTSEEILTSILKECLNINDMSIPFDGINTEDKKIELKKDAANSYNEINKSFLNLIGRALSEEFSSEDNIKLLIFTIMKSLSENDDKIDSLSTDEQMSLILKIKIKFIDNYFESLLPVFRILNKKGFTEKNEILKYMITVYQKALSPYNKINCFETFVSNGYTFNLSKKTSNDYCNEMIIIYSNKLKIIDQKKKDKDSHVFNTTILEKFIKVDYIYNFIEFENILIEEKYFDNQNKWIKPKTKLIIFIMILHNYRYFQGKYYSADEKLQNNLLVDIRIFFEERYSISIVDLFRPNKRKNIKLGGEFLFIFPPKN